MINNNLLYGVAALLAGSSYTIPSHMAFGSTTGTLTADDIITSGEFDRNALSSKTYTLNKVTYEAVIIASEASNKYVNVIGLHNDGTLGSSGNLQANFLVSSLLHTTAFDLSAELWITFERSV
jgi:UDP-glucose 4-epimerase